MAISPSKRNLAVCERADHAVCFVYDLHAPNRKPRVLTSTEIDAAEFVDVKFAHSSEKLTNFLLTLVSPVPPF